MEDVHADQQPVVKFSMPQTAQVSKSDIPSGGNKPFVSKEKDLSKKVADTSDSNIVDSAADIISSFENSMSNKRGGFDKSTGKWFPHASVEGGMQTIAYGHKITSNNELAFDLSERGKATAKNRFSIEFLEGLMRSVIVK